MQVYHTWGTCESVHCKFVVNILVVFRGQELKQTTPRKAGKKHLSW